MLAGEWELLQKTNKKQFKKEDTTMGLGSVILEARNNRFGGYVYGRWKQKI